MPKPKNQLSPHLGRRNVYILGAGTSASCGIAIAGNILCESITRIGDENFGRSERCGSPAAGLYHEPNEQDTRDCSRPNPLRTKSRITKRLKGSPRNSILTRSVELNGR